MLRYPDFAGVKEEVRWRGRPICDEDVPSRRTAIGTSCA